MVRAAPRITRALRAARGASCSNAPLPRSCAIAPAGRRGDGVKSAAPARVRRWRALTWRHGGQAYQDGGIRWRRGSLSKYRGVMALARVNLR